MKVAFHIGNELLYVDIDMQRVHDLLAERLQEEE